MEQDAPVFFSTPYPELNAILEQVYRHRGADGRGSLRQLSEVVDKLVEKWAAARAPADSVTAPAGGVVAGPEWKWVPVEPTEEMLAAAHDGDREYTLRNFGDVMTVMQGPYDHWAAMIDAAPTPPAQAADSVLEDAARYRWLAAHCRSTSGRGGGWSIVVDGPAPKSHDSEDDFDAAIDAARKQGANHDQ